MSFKTGRGGNERRFRLATQPLELIAATKSPQSSLDRASLCLLAVTSGTPLFGHGCQHLADVRGQQVIHFVALAS